MTARQLRAQLREALSLSALCAGALAIASTGLILLLTGGSLRPLLVRRDYTGRGGAELGPGPAGELGRGLQDRLRPQLPRGRNAVSRTAVRRGQRHRVGPCLAGPAGGCGRGGGSDHTDGQPGYSGTGLRPDLESCRWHTAVDPSDSRNHLYLLFDPSTLELYILEFFCW